MERLPEPELMDTTAQAEAYALADFSVPHQTFVDRYARCFPHQTPQRVADLGCGPADVTLRFARLFPHAEIDAYDGAPAMLVWAKLAVGAAGARVRLIQCVLPSADLPAHHYDCVISNSLLHHLHDPAVLWQSVRRIAAPGASVFIGDLHRPADEAEVQHLVATYASEAPPVLREDFGNSLRAAFHCDEIEAQLRAADLERLRVERTSDRHVLIYGQLP